MQQKAIIDMSKATPQEIYAISKALLQLSALLLPHGLKVQVKRTKSSPVLEKIN